MFNNTELSCPLQIPFTLTLRVWDVYLLEGERILTGMAYNLLKMHRRNLSRLGMDEILQYLQARHVLQNKSSVGITLLHINYNLEM